MKQHHIVLGIGIAVIFQLCVLAGEYLNASIPLWTGKEIKIRTTPVDPRSLFRGNYALLTYEISQIDVAKLPNNNNLRNGEKIYVKLKPSKNGLFEFKEASLDQPGEGVFIRGRIANRQYEDGSRYFRLKYGIEAYFAPKEKALRLQKQLSNGGIAVLMITDSGKAALKSILPDQK